MPGKGPSDGQVEGYQRVVNGRVVQVAAYAKGGSTNSVVKKARELPGRPRIKAQPGTFASGRSIPGVKAMVRSGPKDEHVDPPGQ